MAKLTIRATEADETVIDTLKEHLGEKAATKALMKAAELVPQQAARVRELEERNQKLCNLLSNYRESANGINSALECFKIYSNVLKECERKDYINDQIEFRL